RAPPSPERRLVRSSLLGALYVLASVYLVCAGLPWFWTEVLNLRNEFLSGALLVLVEMAAIVGVVFLGRALEGPQPVHGLRAGVFFFCLFFLIDLWISYRLAWEFGEDSGSGGMIGSLIAFVGIGLFFFWMVRKPGFARFLQRTEDRGWFHATAYKPNQGLKVRRSTVVALLVLGLCGVITLTRTLGSDRPGPNNQTISNDWEMTIPFAGEPGSSL